LAKTASLAALQHGPSRGRRVQSGDLLRPIVQDTLFPTICCGRSERAGVLGQLRGVYEHFGVPMPLMYPSTVTLVDSAALRFLTSAMLPRKPAGADEAALNALLTARFRRGQRVLPPQDWGSIARWARHQAIPGVDPRSRTRRGHLGRMRHDLPAAQQDDFGRQAPRRDAPARQFMRTRAGLPAVRPERHRLR
jgi:hypothetical protein